MRDSWTAKQHHWKSEANEDHQLSPGGPSNRRNYKLRSQPTKMNSFRSLPSQSLTPESLESIVLTFFKVSCFTIPHFPLFMTHVVMSIWYFDIWPQFRIVINGISGEPHNQKKQPAQCLPLRRRRNKTLRKLANAICIDFKRL